jgi:hypothetical protein
VQIANERIELAHIFAPALFGFQLALPHHDRQIANIVESFPRQVFAALVPSYGGIAFGEIELQAGGVRELSVANRVSLSPVHRLAS